MRKLSVASCSSLSDHGLAEVSHHLYSIDHHNWCTLINTIITMASLRWEIIIFLSPSSWELFPKTTQLSPSPIRSSPWPRWGESSSLLSWKPFPKTSQLSSIKSSTWPRWGESSPLYHHRHESHFHIHHSYHHIFGCKHSTNNHNGQNDHGQDHSHHGHYRHHNCQHDDSW